MHSGLFCEDSLIKVLYLSRKGITYIRGKYYIYYQFNLLNFAFLFYIILFLPADVKVPQYCNNDCS